MRTLLASTLFALALGLPSLASAKGAICEHVQEDMFGVDGMLDDWEGFKSTDYGEGRDAKLALRCAYDSTNLYLSLRAWDERLVRSNKGKEDQEDKVSVTLDAGGKKKLSFAILPGSSGFGPKKLRVPSFVELEDSLQDRGFSVEMAIPLNKVPGWSASVPYLRGKVLFHDVDEPKRRAEDEVGLNGKVHFSDAVSTYKDFMRQTGLKNSDLRLDKLADVDTGAGVERVIVGKRIIGLLGAGYTYMTLPIASPEDLLSVKLVDFDGGGRCGIVTELRQHGNGGSRDIVAVWFAQGDGSFMPALIVETKKQMGDNHITNSWEITPRGKYRDDGKKKRRKKSNTYPPGADLLVRATDAAGFSAENFREAPASDAKPILLPWGDKTSAVYYLDGTSAYGGDPAVGLEE